MYAMDITQSFNQVGLLRPLAYPRNGKLETGDSGLSASNGTSGRVMKRDQT